MTGSFEVEEFVCVDHTSDSDGPTRVSSLRKRRRSDAEASVEYESSEDEAGYFASSYISKKFSMAVDAIQVQYMPFLDESHADDATFAKLWGFYQQARLGDAPAEAPHQNKKRHFAEWRALEGLSSAESMRRYVSIAKCVTTLDYTQLKFDVAQEKVVLYYLPFVGEDGGRDLFKLFGLYKQATIGDVPEGTAPEDNTEEAKKKLEAWKAETGRDARECMKEYIALADIVTRTTAQRIRS